MGKKFSLVTISAGALLVLIGSAFLVSSFLPGVSGFSLWPLFLLLPVVNMLAGVQNRQELAKVIFWVIYLSYLVVFFLILNFLGWDKIEYLWPHFILAAAASFLAEFLVTWEKQKLWEMFIVALISAYFFVPGLPLQVLGGILLILWGITILFHTLFPSSKRKKE
ncbi:MAG: hypothetical protein N2314_04545 [Brevinematales bacterium]|nr:hypothetical protein [Brevinematales bacterium]